MSVGHLPNLIGSSLEKRRTKDQDRRAREAGEVVLTCSNQPAGATAATESNTKCDAAAEPGDAGVYEKTLRQITGTNMMSLLTFCFRLFNIS